MLASKLRATRSFSLTTTATAAMAKQMQRTKNGEFTCSDFKEFRPNLSPKEILQKGSFGGTYFRNIVIAGKRYNNTWKEFEHTGWFEGLDIKKQVASSVYNTSINNFGVKCGQDLDAWLEKGWINTDYDSHGWFHWYCRFFLGRRCEDDERQVKRWIACAGKKGRWKRNLIGKCVRAGRPYSDRSVSPVVRQTLQHWAYELTQDHHDKYKKEIQKGQSTSFIPQVTMQHLVKKTESNPGKRKERQRGANKAAKKLKST